MKYWFIHKTHVLIGNYKVPKDVLSILAQKGGKSCILNETKPWAQYAHHHSLHLAPCVMLMSLCPHFLCSRKINAEQLLNPAFPSPSVSELSKLCKYKMWFSEIRGGDKRWSVWQLNSPFQKVVVVSFLLHGLFSSPYYLRERLNTFFSWLLAFCGWIISKSLILALNLKYLMCPFLRHRWSCVWQCFAFVSLM